MISHTRVLNPFYFKQIRLYNVNNNKIKIVQVLLRS